MLLSCDPRNYPTKPIELKYYANGPWAVTEAIVWNCCDSAGNKFDLYNPSGGAPPPGGFPILTWGNGTNSPSSHSSYFLKTHGFLGTCSDRHAENCTDTSTMTQGSIFLIDGSLDIPISPPNQPASATGL